MFLYQNCVRLTLISVEEEVRVLNKEPVKKAKKGILSIVFSRISLLAVLLIIQIALIVGTVTYLEDYATYIYVIFMVFGDDFVVTCLITVKAILRLRLRGYCLSF